MSAVADLETYDVVDVFIGLMDEESSTKSYSVVKFGLDEITSVKNAKTSVDVKSVYKISDEFKKETGIFGWNVATKNWEKLKDVDTEITYTFKVDDKMAEVSVSSFKAVATSISDDKIGNIQTELPLELKMHIKLGDKTLTSFELTAEWNADNTPKKLVETFILEDFKFACELTNTNSILTFETVFKHVDFTIYANGIELDGKFDYKTVMNTGFSDNEYSEDLGQELLEKGNVWFQLGGIKAEGVFDVNNFVKELDPKTKPSYQDLVDLLNEHSKLYIKYADENEIIAKGEFFIDEFEDYGETKTEISFRMIFSDGSAVADDFFKTGFSKMITDISDLIEDLNSNYDLYIDNID